MDDNKKSVFKRLTDTNDIRIKEELTRPRVETYLDDWAAWVQSHETKRGKEQDFTHFGIGWH